MRTRLPTRTLLMGASLLGATLFTGATAHAVDIYQTVNQSGANAAGWAAAIWGTPAAAPLATTNYFCTNTFRVRTPDNATPPVFAGASLTIDTGGILWLKNTTPATVNLKLTDSLLAGTGGQIQFHGSGSALPTLAGTIQVFANANINTDQSGANLKDIPIASTITGTGNLTLANGAGFAVILSGNNSGYSGNWVNSGGYVKIAGGTTNALGSGTFSLVNANNTLVIDSTNNMVINNQIGGAGSLVKYNTNTVTLGGVNSYGGSTVVSNGVIKLISRSAISSSALISLAGTTLDASAIAGLVLNDAVAQSMNCRGTVIGDLTATTGNTLNFSLTTATNDLLNVTGSLTLNGTPTLVVTLTGLKSSGTYRLINYTGTILGGGSFNLVPPAGSSQTFSLDYSTAGQVNLMIVGDPKILTWVGDGGGNTWDAQITTLNWTNPPAVGTTNFTQGDYVTFSDAGSAVPNINVAEPVIPSTMTVSNTSLSYEFDGLGITSVGVLTKLGTNALVLNNDGNAFTGPVDIRAGVLSIGSGLGTGSLGNPSSITNNGLFLINKGFGSTAITVNGPISGSGAVQVTGGTAGQGGAILTLNASNSYAGLTTVGDECQLLFTNASGLGSAGGRTVVLANGRLGIPTFVGAMTLAEPLTLNGGGITTGNNQGGALYVVGASNNITLTAPITIASDARVRVLDPNSRMTFMNTVLGTNVALRVSVGGQPADAATLMTFSNTVSIGSGALTKDGQGMAAFASASNVAGSTTINEGSLLANGVINGGPVTVNASGTLGGSGTVQGPVSVGSGGTLSPGNAGIGTLTLSSTLSLNATATTRMEINRTNAQNADLLVSGVVPMNGVLTVVNTGPALQVGDSFNLIDGAISGAFTTKNLPALALINHYWDTSQLGTLGIITVASNTLPVLPLLITDLKPNPGNVVLTWNSYPSRSYSVECLTSLNTNNWITLATNIPANSVTNFTTSVVDTSGSGSGLNNLLVEYQMGSVDAQIQDATNTMAAGPLVNGGGLSLFNANANVTPAYASAPELQASPPNGAATLVDAYNASSFFSFALTVGASVTDLDLTSLSFNGSRGGGAVPRGYGAYVILPDFTEVEIRGATDFTDQRPNWVPQSIDLTGVAGLQNLTAGQVVTFKVVVYAPQSANSVEFDDIAVRGNITPRPVTAYEASDKLFFRVRQQ